MSDCLFFKEQRNLLVFSGFMLMVILISMAGCGKLQEQVVIRDGKTGQIPEMTASSFSFEPNNFQAYKGDTFVMHVSNTAGMEHNITVRNPAGEVVLNADLPAQETVKITVELEQAGKYTFYCDKPFHETLGMTGRIEVIERE